MPEKPIVSEEEIERILKAWEEKEREREEFLKEWRARIETAQKREEKPKPKKSHLGSLLSIFFLLLLGFLFYFYFSNPQRFQSLFNQIKEIKISDKLSEMKSIFIKKETPPPVSTSTPSTPKPKKSQLFLPEILEK